MPIFKCLNGKYRIGSGACIYDTEDKATKVWQAILASGAYAADPNKVSIDFDDTLDTERGKALAKRLISEGKTVYIVTRRQQTASEAVYKVADELGIPKNRVKFTNGAYKWETIKHYGIGTHYDNNSREVELINSKTTAKGIKFAVQDSYTDYPEAATNNAKRALKYVEANGWRECGTPVGKARANQLANKEPISRDTIARMSSFKRHQQNKNVPYEKGCGGLMWDAWGGDEGIEWAQKKLQQIDNEQFKEGVPHYTKEGILWTGETHKDASGKLMTGAIHTEDSEYLYHKEDL